MVQIIKIPSIVYITMSDDQLCANYSLYSNLAMYKLNKYMHASEGIYWTQLLLILLLESGKIQNL